MKTSIIILCYNNLEYTKQCIESIRKNTERDTYEIIVIDNASSDGTKEWIKEQEDIVSIFNENNIGFPRGCNQGIDRSNGDNVLLLNNDVIVTPNWLHNLTIALYSNENIGAVGAITNSCSYNQAIQTNYKNYDELMMFATQINVSDFRKWEERLKLIGFCMLIKRNVVEKIGLLDERFTPGNFEDDDYSYRIREAGYKLLLCKDSFIHHYGSVSFGKDYDEYNKILTINKEKFKDKWGFDPTYSSFVRNEIVNLINGKLDRNIKVLEIGCACGGTLLEIKNRYKNSELYGIELNENSASIAKLIANVKAENIENEQLSYEEKYFDYIIFADVLEHLYDPCKVLINMKKYLKDNGKILASIPNVMHYSVIRQLLNGNWSYVDAGILDRTHVRFFTYKEIINMFKKAGYGEIDTSCNVIPISNKQDEVFIKNLTCISNENFEIQYKAYQYLVTVNKLDKNSSLDLCLKNIILDIDKEKTAEILKDYPSNEILYYIKNKMSNKVEALNAIAVYNYNHGKFDEVIPFLSEAFSIDNKHKDTLFNLGVVLYSAGEYIKARNYFEKIENKDSLTNEYIDAINSEI